MSVRVQAPQARSGGLFNSPAMRIGKTAAGVMSGDPALIAGGLSSGNSPVGKAAGMYEGMGAMMRNFGGGGGGVTGQVGADGSANLGVNTQFQAPQASDYGMGAPQAQPFEMPQMGSMMGPIQRKFSLFGGQ